MSRWSHSEDTYLAMNFATATMDEMVAHLGRSKDGIYCRAKILGLQRPNRGRIGHGRFLVGTPFRLGSIPHKTNVRDAVIKALTEHVEQTSRQLASAAKVRSVSSVWTVCALLRKQKNIHIVRFQPCPTSPGNIEAVYRIGHGVDAVHPTKDAPEQKKDIYKPDPIPRPVLGAWGCVWTTAAKTTEPAVPAER